MKFKCDHPNVPDNHYKVGKGRVRCRICHLEWRKRHDTTYVRPSRVKASSVEDVEMADDPFQGSGRDPLALRRFSWET